MKQIGTEELESFRKLVQNRIGLSIRTEDSESLRKNLLIRMKNLNISSPHEYFRLLESETDESKKEWKALILVSTTGESYFFRDKGHFHLLQHTILPELIQRKQNSRSLRIWSAGCSTGEEPYSVAILLDKLLPDINEWKIDIFGTDINDEYLRKAERGIYSDWSFRLVDKEIQKKYFDRHPDGWEIHENLKVNVRFTYGNLMEAGFFSKYPEVSDIDLIICRNVFIYFKIEAVAAVISNFTKIMNTEGYLITGHGELHGLDLSGLKQIMSPEAVIYKKTTNGTKQSPATVQTPELPKKKTVHTVKTVPVTREFPILKIKTVPHDPVPELEKLLIQRRYTDVIEQGNRSLQVHKGDCRIPFIVAQAYANTGDYENAENFSRKAITANTDFPDPYFLLAQIAEVRAHDEEAKFLLNKVIYLDSAFIAAYCELGALHERHNDHDRALKFRNTAIKLLMSVPADSTVKPYNIPAGELLASVSSLVNL